MQASETIAQKARRLGFLESVRVRGRAMRASTGERILAIVSDEPILMDAITSVAQAQKPIYATVSTIAGAVANPRAVTTFTEVGGRAYDVIRYDESAADAVSWKWFCESDRQLF